MKRQLGGSMSDYSYNIVFPSIDKRVEKFVKSFLRQPQRIISDRKKINYISDLRGAQRDRVLNGLTTKIKSMKSFGDCLSDVRLANSNKYFNDFKFSDNLFSRGKDSDPEVVRLAHVYLSNYSLKNTGASHVAEIVSDIEKDNKMSMVEYVKSENKIAYLNIDNVSNFVEEIIEEYM